MRLTIRHAAALGGLTICGYALLGFGPTAEARRSSAAQTGGSAGARAAAQTMPAAPATDLDYSRLVRYWDAPSVGAGKLAYGYAEPVGSRIVLSSNTPAQSDLPLLASAGFTLLQTDSDHLGTEETRPNVWDFSQADRGRDLARGRGFDWAYFPHYAFPPAWYSEKIQYPRIRCLEHDQTVEAMSPWDPNCGYFVGRGYQHLAKHYARPSNAEGGLQPAPTQPVDVDLPALYLGVHGDYGECGLMIGARVAVPGQKEDWERRFGNLHNHMGWWCGDALARGAFRSAMLTRYGGLSALNSAWRTEYRGPDEIAYPVGAEPPAAALASKRVSRRHWLDWVTWYRQGVSNIADIVCRVARRNFPDALMMLPCGFGDEDPRSGADNSMLVKVAARHRVDVRSTHGGHKPFPQSQASMLGRLASASRFYGAPFWTEPPSVIEPAAQVARIFETISLGARGHFDWTANVKSGRDAYYRYGKHMRVSRRVTDVAMFFPTTAHLLRPDEGYPQTFEQGCTMIRDVLDYDIVDERMVLDGALERYRVLAMWEGAVIEGRVLDQIRTWIERGGTLVAYDFGKIETVEGDGSWARDVLGYAGKLTPSSGNVRFVPDVGVPLQDAYRVSVAEPAADAFLEGDWEAPEIAGGVQRRWTGAEATVRFPVKSGSDLVLTVRASFPPEAAGLRREVHVNGTQVGILDLAGEHTYRFAVPSSLTARRAVARVTLHSETFVPSARIPGSQDGRSLGVWVTYVQLAADTASAALTDPGPPRGRFEVAINHRALRSEWARRLGLGWTIYFPARKDQLAAYCEVVRYAAYHLSDLDPQKQDAIVVDDAWDGVYATLCTDKIVYYNPGPRQVLRTIVLSPSAFSEQREVEKPSRLTHELTLDPASIAVVPFTKPPTEMLLQCEKFTLLGELKPQAGAQFSPGEGATHVLVPEGGQITTRFECAVPGRYRVYYRSWRRNGLCQAQLTINGKPCEPVRGAPAASSSQPAARSLPGLQTRRAGEVTLTRGVHSLTIRPLPGEDLRADFVVLTDDPAISGYGFAVK